MAQSILSIFAFLLLISKLCSSQNLLNQYQDLTGEPIFGYSIDGNQTYWGEFQVFLNEIHEDISSVGSGIYGVWYETECVSFPFQLPEWNQVSSNNRWLVMPQQELSSQSISEIDPFLFNTFYQRNGTSSSFPIYSNYVNEIEGNEGYSDASTVRSTLISSLIKSASATSYYAYNQGRTYFPHGILKYTFHFECEDEEFYKFSFLVDLTRGQLRKYPYLDNFSESNNVQSYDLQIRPRYVWDPLGHNYNESSNASWINPTESGTINYFDNGNSFFTIEPQLCQPALFPEDPEVNYQGQFLSAPPYALLDAVVLNHDATSYAGYQQTSNGAVAIPTVPNSQYTQAMAWEFFIDRPFDVTTINADERVVYLPEVMHIGKPVFDGQQLPSDYLAVDQVFPSGYTFKTVYGKYPSKDDYDAELSQGYADNYNDCHPESDVVDSQIIVENGSTLTIEDCVRLMDCVITVNSGGTLIYSSSRVVGNFTIVNNGGTVQDLSAISGSALFCGVECQDPVNYDMSSWYIDDGDSELIDEVFSVRGDITIESGGELEIAANGTLYLGPYARIIVQNGGKLTCNGGTITSACDRMWFGIEVWSLFDAIDEIPGEVRLIDANIKNAHVGVTVAKNLYLPGGTQVLFPAEGTFALNSDGGLLVSENCTYENCGIGIAYHRGYHQAVAAAAHPDTRIVGNTFTTTGAGLLNKEYNMYHGAPYPNDFCYTCAKANSETRGSIGVFIEGIRDIVVGGNLTTEGNMFENLEMGVRQFGSNCDIINNDFDRCQYGIYMSNASHFWNTSGTQIQNNLFTNIFDPNPQELNELPYPDGEYQNNVSLLAINDAGNSACIRIEGCKMIRIRDNIFNDQFDGPIQTGLYLENVAGLYVSENSFNNLKRGIVCWDSDDTDLNQALIGMEDLSDDRNVFNNCESNILLGGLNNNLLIRCNTFNNGFDFEKNVMNRGVLGDQGTAIDVVSANDEGAGNVFDENLNDIYSLGDPELIEEYNDMYGNDYQGWTYYHYVNEDHIPEIVNEDIEVIVSDLGIPYIEGISCDSPYNIVTDDGGGQHHVMDLNELTIAWQDEMDHCQDLIAALDDFNTNTPALLNAIYGGITNEIELANYLKDNSPLSDTVLQAYINRTNVPIIYLAEVIEMNGELDEALHLLVGEKIENLPATIANYIYQICANNPAVESVAQSKRRIAHLNKARQALLKEEFCEVVKLQGSTVALMLLSNESDAVKKTVEYELKRHDGNLTDAHSAILQIPLQSEKLEQFVEDGKQLIFWMQQNQAFGRYDSVQKVILASRLFPDPTNDSYTTNKYFWGATGEFPMYFPKEAPEERSGRFRKDKSNFQALSVYPNPCENYIRVNAAMAQDEVAVFELLDIMGRVVFSSNFNSHGHDPLLVLPDLVEGSYLYRIRCFDQVFTGKIQVK